MPPFWTCLTPPMIRVSRGPLFLLAITAELRMFACISIPYGHALLVDYGLHTMAIKLIRPLSGTFTTSSSET